MSRFWKKVFKVLEAIQMMLFFGLFLGPIVAVGTKVRGDWPYPVPAIIVFPVVAFLFFLVLASLNLLLVRSLSRILERRGIATTHDAQDS